MVSFFPCTSSRSSWIERPPSVREVMGSIQVSSLSHALFTFHISLQSLKSTICFHLSKNGFATSVEFCFQHQFVWSSICYQEARNTGQPHASNSRYMVDEVYILLCTLNWYSNEITFLNVLNLYSHPSRIHRISD